MILNDKCIFYFGMFLIKYIKYITVKTSKYNFTLYII